MATPISLLLYGRDAALLEIRQRVLQSAGYQVWTAAELTEVSRIVARERIALLILCHTLSMEECGRVLALQYSGFAARKSLILITAGTDSCDDSSNNVLSTMEGPAKLIHTVAKLVSPEINISLTHHIVSTCKENEWHSTQAR